MSAKWALASFRCAPEFGAVGIADTHAFPATATTDLLQPDILNRFGGAVPAQTPALGRTRATTIEIYFGGGGSAPICCSKAKRSGTPQCSTSFPLLKRHISTTSISTGLPERGSVPVALHRAQTVSSVWTEASNVSFRSVMLLHASSIWDFRMSGPGRI